MKKIFFALMAMASMAQTRSSAQALCPGSGSLPDIPWYTSVCPLGPSTRYISAINTAMIDFPAVVQPKIPAGSLIGSVYSGNGTAGGVSFRDVNSGFTVTIPYCTTSDYIDKPGDIILGNDPAQPLTAFRAAVVFYQVGTGLPQINYYRISYTSATNFTVLLTGSTVFSPPFPGDWVGSVAHIDVIADYSNTALTGFPWCNDFVVTWDDIASGLSWAHKASLSAPPAAITPALPTIIVPFASRAMQPDVAAIQRLNPGTGAIEQIGLFTAHDGANVYFTEYNWTTPGPFTPITHSPPGAQPPVFPRIDAPDDYTINAPTTPGLCYYKIAAQLLTGVGAISRVFDNQNWPGDDDDWFYAGLYTIGNFSPTVAYGGNNGQQYQVLHYLDGSGGGGTPGVYMEPINWMSPLSSTVLPDVCGPNQYFYKVNNIMPLFANGMSLNAISTPCNNPTASTLCAWADFDHLTQLSTVYYKITAYGGPSCYTFRPGPQEAPVELVAKWRVYPSPADATLTVESPADGSYRVADVLGRTVREGRLQAGTQPIDISSLAPGSYIISRYVDGKRTDQSTFMKQ